MYILRVLMFNMVIPVPNFNKWEMIEKHNKLPEKR